MEYSQNHLFGQGVMVAAFVGSVATFGDNNYLSFSALPIPGGGQVRLGAFPALPYSCASFHPQMRVFAI